MTTPHYGYITSKVASDYYRNYVIPQLAANSAWKTQIPTPYSFVDDPKGFLNNKKSRESMLVVHQAGGGLKPNYQLIAQSLASHGSDLMNEGLAIQVNGINGANAQVQIADQAAVEQDNRKLIMDRARRAAKLSRSQILGDYTQRGGSTRNYTAMQTKFGWSASASATDDASSSSAATALSTVSSTAAITTAAATTDSATSSTAASSAAAIQS
jgi:hypothetical protein